jgi:hypothetical protein
MIFTEHNNRLGNMSHMRMEKLGKTTGRSCGKRDTDYGGNAAEKLTM